MKYAIRLALVLAVAGNIAFAVRVPAEMKKTVGFIFVENANGEKVPNGTCFFVGILKDKTTSKGWAYLVTADHVLRGPDGNYLPRIWLL